MAASYLSFRWTRTRHLIEGIPVVVVRDGRTVDVTLRRERLDVEELLGAARAQGIADLGEIAVGVLEPDGRFSFIKADQAGGQPPDQDRQGV